MNVKEISKLSNLVEIFLKEYAAGGKELLLYGAGHYCDFVLRLLNNYNIIPAYIVDKMRGGGRKMIL